MDASKTIISLVGVSKAFDGVTVVDNFNLDVKRGEFVTILGPSGCGKSTTLRMIAGFEQPTSGEILLNGQDISKIPAYKRPVNTVFQHYALFPNLDVYDNVAFGLRLEKVAREIPLKNGKAKTKFSHLSEKEIDEKVSKALEIVDLEELEDRDVNSLSGGQQQRVAIARAIVLEPEVLLLDEPLSALDHKMRKEMQLELKDMHRKLGITFIYVTHDQEEALTMSDTVIVMKGGVIQQVGTPEAIYNEPVNSFVADFIGESNIYNGTVVGKKKVRFLGAVWNCIDDFKLNEKVDIVIRPEDVVIGNPGKGTVDGTISSKIFQGIHYSYVVNVGKNEVSCRDTRDRKVGTAVSVHVVKENIQVMHKDVTENEYEDAWINKDGDVVIGEDAFPCDLLQLLPNLAKGEDGVIYDPKTKKRYDFNDAEVVASVALGKVEISDDLSAGRSKGVIIASVWIGDHYQLLIRTDDEEDYIVNTPYEWNQSETVSIDIASEDITRRLKKDPDNYVIA